MPNYDNTVGVETLLNALTSTGVGSSFQLPPRNKSFQLKGTTSSGAGAAAVQVEASNTGTTNEWVVLGTISLTLGTTVTSDALPTTTVYKYYRGNVISISGTGAAVTLLAAV